ncbi:MAG: hypothetical protein ACR2M1_13345 [Gemmatimonadaceae bacterium]
MKPPEKSPEPAADLLAVLRWAVQAGAVLECGARSGLRLRSPEPPPPAIGNALSRVAPELAARLSGTGAPSPFFAVLSVWFTAELLAATEDELAAADERIAVRQQDGQARTVAELLGLAELATRAVPTSIPVAA